jgi:hypothetical protein
MILRAFSSLFLAYSTSFQALSTSFLRMAIVWESSWVNLMAALTLAAFWRMVSLKSLHLLELIKNVIVFQIKLFKVSRQPFETEMLDCIYSPKD